MQNNIKAITKVSHIFVLSHSRHVIPYVDFIRKSLIDSKLDHKILIYSNEDHQLFEELHGEDLTITNQRKYVVKTIRSANSDHKVILHGIYDNLLLLSLIFNVKALQHVIWSMWGADVYYDLPRGIKGSIIQLARKWILPRIGTKIGLKGDFEYLQRITHSPCKDFVEIGFPAWYYNLEDRASPSLLQTKPEKLSALVGNSADETNNHHQTIDLLSRTKIFSSLTFILNYGSTDKEIANIISCAKKKLPDINLVFLTSSMEYFNFIELVKSHDALIYNHDRQQGVGTLNIACEYGLYLFIPKQNPLHNTYSAWGIDIKNTHEIPRLKREQLSCKDVLKKNQKYMRNIYHPTNCARKIIKLLRGT